MRPYAPMQPIPDPYGYGGGYYPGGRWTTRYPYGPGPTLPTVRPVVRNRKAERVLVTVISNLDYDPKLNDARLHASRTWVIFLVEINYQKNFERTVPARKYTPIHGRDE
ncbi:unnamed protein product [Cylicostephanus goldi]|uniref:Uncharacterized protein n=1 Tax=Cylicostephanus goldi TaxID=71465 RepID=A0A3P6QTE6_CYLGO|nr:unnamed protein product [Cylicostephanus goldi]